MKKNLFMVAAVALMAMVSCNKIENNNGGEPQVQEPSYYVEFTAEAANEEPTTAPAQSQTKTTFDEANKKTKWESEDEISVNGKKFITTELTNGDLSARFVNNEELGEFGKPYVAVTPYQSTHKVNGTKVEGVVLKSEQTAKSASFESNAVIAMAYNAEGNTLAFKNACSIVKFKVGTANVKEVTITSNNGENLAGTVTLDYNNGEPTAKVTANGTSTIKLTGTFNTTSTYYVAVLASGLENGITISLDGTIAKTVANELAFKRNIVMNAGTLSVVSTAQSVWKIAGAHNGWNTNGNSMYKERGLLVAKGISIESGGFKFVKNNSWDVAVGAGGNTLNQWHSAGGSNIEPGAGTYDIYLEENGKAYYIASAGSPAPTAWTVYGCLTSTSWTDIQMYPMGEYLVAKNVKISNPAAKMQFRTYGGATSYYITGVDLKPSAKTVHKTTTDSYNKNISYGVATVDIYLTGNANFFFIVPAGHSLNDSDIKLDKYTLIGDLDGTSWNTDKEMYVCGDYFGRKDVVCGGGFKIRYEKDWTTQWGYNSTSGSLYNNSNSKNIPANGTFDILVDHDFKKYWLK